MCDHHIKKVSSTGEITYGMIPAITLEEAREDLRKLNEMFGGGWEFV